MRAKLAPIREIVAALTPTIAPQLNRRGGPSPNGGFAWALRTDATTSKRATTVKRTYTPTGTLRPTKSAAKVMIATVAAPHERVRIKNPHAWVPGETEPSRAGSRYRDSALISSCRRTNPTP